MEKTKAPWDGDFPGNEAGYPVNHNPYMYWNPLSDPPQRVVTDAQKLEAFKNLGVLHDALDLIVELWPKPGYSTVQLESHQWIKLRRVLLEIPRLVAADE